MPLPTIFALAFALAMDAFAVSIATGMQLRCVSVAQTLRMAGAFGFFQFLMPVAGWFLGAGAQKYIQDYDHWLAFALLALVGYRMIRESRNQDKNKSGYKCIDPTTGGTLWMLAVATSLDALAVGLSLAFLEHTVWLPALLVGLVCLLLSALGMSIGALACKVPYLGSIGNKANAFGGLVLLAIALKILYEHNVFG